MISGTLVNDFLIQESSLDIGLKRLHKMPRVDGYLCKGVVAQ